MFEYELPLSETRCRTTCQLSGAVPRFVNPGEYLFQLTPSSVILMALEPGFAMQRWRTPAVGQLGPRLQKPMGPAGNGLDARQRLVSSDSV